MRRGVPLLGMNNRRILALAAVLAAVGTPLFNVAYANAVPHAPDSTVLAAYHDHIEDHAEHGSHDHTESEERSAKGGMNAYGKRTALSDVGPIFTECIVRTNSYLPAPFTEQFFARAIFVP